MSRPRLPRLLPFTSLILLGAACSDAPAPTGPTPGAAPSAGKASSSTRAIFWIANAPDTFGLRGDALASYLDADGSSRYAHGECGVTTQIFDKAGGTGDGIMDTGSGTRTCRRTVRLRYSRINPDGSITDEGVVTTSTFLNVRKLLSVTSTSGEVPLTLAFDDNGTKCGTSGTGAILFAASQGSDDVLVRRDPVTGDWYVRTQPDAVDESGNVVAHHDRARCKATGALYHMPLSLRIRML
jgi:hypothetical protein